MPEQTQAFVDDLLIGQRRVTLADLPQPLALHARLGLVLGPGLDGQVVHENPNSLFETRATITPGGDYLLMFPDALPGVSLEVNCHYGSKDHKVNNLVAYRSHDKGRTWEGPSAPIRIDYNLHGFIPLIPRGTSRIYNFGTQPLTGKFNGIENAVIGFRYSDDDGYTWSDVTLIEPLNDPEYMGMSVMRMCETESGAWLLGTHTGSAWVDNPEGGMTARSRCYLLRSEDQGKSWELLPGARPAGWYLPKYERMDEIRPIALAGSRALAFIRTCEGHLWAMWSEDDGRTWSAPAPTPLIHSDAPPMLFHLSDGKTLAAFHHNTHTGSHFNDNAMIDRGQLWVSFSHDDGHTWTEPRFVLANALATGQHGNFFDFCCSYLDMFTDGDQVHLFLPHRWRRALHLSIAEAELLRLPTKAELG